MASITCGHCGGTHESVQDVRSCYQGDTTVQTIVKTDERITDKQVKFLAVLRTERGLTTDGIGKLTKQDATQEIKHHLSPVGRQARRDFQAKNLKTHQDLLDEARTGKNDMTHDDWIEKVRTQRAQLRTEAAQAQARVYASPDPTGAPVRREAWPRFEDIPQGHYATESLTGNNDLDFWRVYRPEKGPWAGRWFLKRVIGGKPNAKVRGKTAIEAMKAIQAADPIKAAERYGQKIGRCYKCNRHLTDETSRLLGIGPDCRSRLS